MGWDLDQQRLQYAFEGRPDLITAITNASAAPNWIELFNEITKHVAQIRDTAAEAATKAQAAAAAAKTSTTAAGVDGPASKRRRLDADLTINGKAKPAAGSSANGTSEGEHEGSSTADPGPVLLEIKEISVVMPQRKKLTLAFTKTHIQALNPQSKEPVPGVSYAWKDIAYAFCLPVPEKAQKQHNYILFPTKRTIPPSRPAADTPSPPDPFIFTIPATAPKPGSFSGPSAQAAASVGDEYKTLLDWAITKGLQEAGREVKIIETEAKIFASELKEAHRPKDTAFHVKAFRGSKDGYLFMLSTGIIFVFKKPIFFLPLDRIQSVSYLAVLQRTFNLAIEALVGEEGETEEIEFAMLDQEDFSGIDTYVKRFGLQDASMAEQRKAKTLGINVVKNENGEVMGVVEAGELAKAGLGGDDEAGGQAMGGLNDEEDSEEDEDFDPGSDGESEGEGDSSSEEDSDAEGGEGDEADDDDDE